ncbi:MAG: TlpA disulfide reductase family protein [Bacteroidales bacterium]|nr:TlpA disulfide reductase family protein [Bacteroidales bacterium]
MRGLLLLLVLFMTSSSRSSEYTISGVIKNYDSNEIIFNPTDNNSVEDVTIKLAKDGSFSYSCVINKDDYGYIKVPGKAYFSLICIGGTSNHIVADAASGWPVITGDLEAAYTFQKMADSIINQESVSYNSFKELKESLAQIKDSLRELSLPIFHGDFTKLHQKYIEEGILYRSMVKYDEILRRGGLEPDSDDAYNDYMEALSITSAFTANKYIYWKEWCITRDVKKQSTQRMLQTAKNRITDKDLLEKISISFLTTFFSKCDDNLDAVYEEALPLMISEKRKSWLNSKYEANKKLLSDSSALDCMLENIGGKKIKLSDLFGKILFIDVWATWCGPCCKEIPYMEKMAKYFALDNRIEFVSISVDKNRDKWVQQLQADKPEWKQFINSEFTSIYGIVGIPCFILIDKNGKILDRSAPRPSDKNFISYIEEYLNKNT